MRQICIACSPPTNWDDDAQLKDHLVTFHGTASMDQAVLMEKQKKANSPVQLPPGVPESAAPTPEFAQMMQEIERNKVSQATPPPTPAPIAPPTPKQPEKIVLKYKYEGQHECGNKINTLELDTDGKHFAVAYCLICNKQVESREVVDLNKLEIKREQIKVDNTVVPLVSKKTKNGRSNTKG